MMLKALPIGSFLERIVVERANDDLYQKNIKKRRSDQRKTDRFLAKRAPKITTKSRAFLPTAFRPSLPRKFPRNRPIFLRFCP